MEQEQKEKDKEVTDMKSKPIEGQEDERIEMNPKPSDKKEEERME